MADWTNLPNQAVGVGGLPSGTTVTALRDNPVAIAEGAPGAPRVNGLALGGVYIGTLARIDTTDPIGINDIGDFETIVLRGLMSPVNSEIQISFSSNNGVTFGDWQRINPRSTLASPGASTYCDYVIRKSEGNIVSSGTLIPTGSSDPSVSDLYTSDTRSLTIPSDANAFRLRNNAVTATRHFSLTAYLIGGTP